MAATARTRAIKVSNNMAAHRNSTDTATKANSLTASLLMIPMAKGSTTQTHTLKDR
jgi:hypothetical protein